MRREILSNARKDSIKMFKQASNRVLQPLEVEGTLEKKFKKPTLHTRSRTRNFQEQFSRKIVHHLQTPALFPKITQSNERGGYETQKSGLDTLQQHLHRMLLKNLKKCRENKNIRSLQDELDKKRSNFKESQEKSQKQNEKNRLQQLRTKLSQLYADLASQQNKLKTQYSIEEKMERKYNEFYDKMTRRFQKNNTVDVGLSTQPPAQTKKQLITQPIQNQQKKKKALSRFRVVAYVVYFSSFFPKYSKFFHKMRKNNYIQAIIQQKSVESSIQECYELFQMMKLKSFWRQLQNRNQDIPQQGVSAILSETDANEQPLQYNFKLENLNSLLAFVLSSIRSTLRAGKTDNFIKKMAYVLTNRSFITDQLFLESELQQINTNQKLIMNLSQNQQKRLLVNLILIKLVAFSFMMNNSFVSEGKSHYIFDKQKCNRFENLTFTISKQLVLCGIYLIRLCNKLNEQSKKAEIELEGNIQLANPENLPLPMPQIQFKSKLAFSKSYGEAVSKRISIEDGIEAFNSEGHGIYVKNIKNISDFLSRFGENTERQAQFMGIITEIRDEIYGKLVVFKRQYYNQLKELTLDKMKNKQNIEIEKSMPIFPQRNEKQKAQIMKYCNYFKLKRPQKQQNIQNVAEVVPIVVQAENPTNLTNSLKSSTISQGES